jgi:hypothetical protein
MTEEYISAEGMKLYIQIQTKVILEISEKKNTSLIHRLKVLENIFKTHLIFNKKQFK